MLVRPDGRELLVLDCHVHMGSSLFYGEPGANTFRGEDIIPEMDRCGVDCVFACPMGNPHTDYVEENDRIIEYSRQYPDRIFAYARIHPWYKEKAVDILKKYVDQGLIKGLKFHPQVDGAYAANSKVLMYPLMEEIKGKGLVVFFHSGEVFEAVPGLIIALAMDFPDINFIIGHHGLHGLHLEAIALAKHVDNVWLDTSWCSPPNVIRTAVRTLGEHRVIFGSDTPYLVMPMEVDKVVKHCGLTEDEIQAVMGTNFAKLINYKPERNKLPKVPLK